MWGWLLRNGFLFHYTGHSRSVTGELSVAWLLYGGRSPDLVTRRGERWPARSEEVGHKRRAGWQTYIGSARHVTVVNGVAAVI
jgi:hypothetical protein